MKYRRIMAAILAVSAFAGVTGCSSKDVNTSGEGAASAVALTKENAKETLTQCIDNLGVKELSEANKDEVNMAIDMGLELNVICGVDESTLSEEDKEAVKQFTSLTSDMFDMQFKVDGNNSYSSIKLNIPDMPMEMQSYTVVNEDNTLTQYSLNPFMGGWTKMVVEMPTADEETAETTEADAVDTDKYMNDLLEIIEIESVEEISDGVYCVKTNLSSEEIKNNEELSSEMDTEAITSMVGVDGDALADIKFDVAVQFTVDTNADVITNMVIDFTQLMEVIIDQTIINADEYTELNAGAITVEAAKISLDITDIGSCKIEVPAEVVESATDMQSMFDIDTDFGDIEAYVE